jgi:hypothetical protein
LLGFLLAFVAIMLVVFYIEESLRKGEPADDKWDFPPVRRRRRRRTSNDERAH